jgi:hypothetical protein
MSLAVSITESDVLKILGDFLTRILPSSVEIVVGQANRVPEVSNADFVVMTPTSRPRLSTNVDTEADVQFTGSIAGTTLTVEDVDFGTLLIGNTVFGVDVVSDTTLLEQLTGSPPGGVGTYRVSQTQTVASEIMAAGATNYMQPTNVIIQLDVHGPQSANNAQIISTMFRDGYAVDFFAAANPEVSPLLADDPRQLPFVNDQKQVENRWVIEAQIEANITIVAPQDYANVVTAELVNVEAEYPAS